MDVDLLMERALDEDADEGGMMAWDGDGNAADDAMAEGDGEVDPLGHVKGGRGAKLYDAPELPHIREGRALMREIRREHELMRSLEGNGEGARVAAGGWGEAAGALVTGHQQQHSAEAQPEGLAHQGPDEMQRKRKATAEPARSGEVLQDGWGTKAQQQQQHSASQGAQPSNTQGSRERVMHLYGFVMERTEQPPAELMGPLGVPIYDAEPFWDPQLRGAPGASPPCPWPKPPPGTPAHRATHQQEGGESSPMAVDGSEQPDGPCFTSGNAEEVEPGWGFHGSCAGHAFGHAGCSWLHNFGMLLHQVIPPTALPPFR